MCGIAGCITSDIRLIPNSTFSRMKDSILYRGRDSQGEWTDGKHVYFFHSRLSVIDITTGHQPMIDVSGRYVIVYNGEIYNYIELREEYKKHGAAFNTQSDTEIILEGFKLKGPEVCIDLNGMYAFAIWDCLQHKLFVARDRLGKKPLFWTAIGGALYFASTLDAFHEIQGWSNQLSNANIIIYQTMGSFWDDTTVYKNANALPAASYAFVTIHDLKPTISKYWHLDFSFKSKNKLGELMEEYEEILTDAVKIRLRSDVPIALSFSGGVDSGTIAALCTRKLNKTVKAFTIDYHTDEDTSEDVLNARQVAEHLGVELHFINYDYRAKLIDDLDKAYSFYDQPCQHLPLVYLFRLYEEIKPYATVTLSGNGADELFTGYIGDQKVRQKDIIMYAARWLRPFVMKTRFEHYFRSPFPWVFKELLIRQARAFDCDMMTAYKVDSIIDRFANEAIGCSVKSVLDMKMFYNIFCSTIGSNYILSDISGLAAQVEVRSPYLDYRVVEFAAKLPHHYKVGNIFRSSLNKYLPKLYYAKHVPKRLAWSKKKGLSYNISFADYIEKNPESSKLFSTSHNAIARAGLNPKNCRTALSRYTASTSKGKKPAPTDSKTLINSFLLGRWLMLNKGLTV